MSLSVREGDMINIEFSDEEWENANKLRGEVKAIKDVEKELNARIRAFANSLVDAYDLDTPDKLSQIIQLMPEGYERFRVRDIVSSMISGELPQKKYYLK